MHLFVSLILLATCLSGTFNIVGDTYMLNDSPIQLISGAFHYFRVHPDYWDDTLMKMAHAGLNTVETYVAWNIHEPERGQYNFEGFGDLVRFVKIAQKYNLMVMLRPGPYICAEHEFGGLPYWLLKEEGIKLRTHDPKYLEPVLNYFDVLLPKLAPYLIRHGGNIIMTQIENEYGSYPACDKEYLRALYNSTVKHFGVPTDYVVFTTDGPSDGMLTCGTLQPLAYATVDFGTGNPTEAFKMMRKYEPFGPLQNGEFYSGWLDHWGEKHQKVGIKAITTSMDAMYKKFRANFNFYMFIGGTNFAFLSGANGGGENHSPQPTSYDYDAPLSEAGDMTPKYEAIRQKINEWHTVATHPVKNHTKYSYGQITFTESASLFESLYILDKNPVVGDHPITFEHLDLDYGYVLYRHIVVKNAKLLTLANVHDRAYVYVNRVFKGLILRKTPDTPIEVNIRVGDVLDILVENQGRLNYGGSFYDPKGILGHVTCDGAEVKRWTMFRLGMKDVSEIPWETSSVLTGPRFYRSEFIAPSVGDTFVKPMGWDKGHVYVNGHNLGRYWTVGPQLTVYCPAPYVKKGHNTIVVFEAIGTKSNRMTLENTPELDIIKDPKCYNDIL